MSSWEDKYMTLLADLQDSETSMGDRLRLLRYKCGKPLTEVAEDVGLHWQTIQAWESNRGGANALLLGYLAKYYGASMDYIVFGEES